MSKQINIKSYQTTPGTNISGGSSGNGGAASSASGPGVSRHEQLDGVVSSGDDYSKFARDIHLTGADADVLKRYGELGIITSTDEETIPSDITFYSALRSQLEDERIAKEMEDKYIRKDKPDETDHRVDFHDGITTGSYLGGFLGSGSVIDKDGNAEMTSLKLREFLEVPELRFNRIDVVSGELWNSIAFGLIESVDEQNLIVTLHLEEGELSGLHINDFCRGIFHNLTGNAEQPGKDGSGFDTLVGFSTAYFTPVEIIDNACFRYELKPGTTVHPSASMKFAVYGNALDKSRQHSAYQTRTYTRFLRNVDTWEIDPGKHVSFQAGDLSNLVINGQPLADGSVYLNNVYFGGNILTVGGLDSLKGKDAYSVTLSTYSAVYNIADGIYEQADVVTNDQKVMTSASQVVASQFNVSTRLQVTKGEELLRYSDVIGKGKYVVTSSGIGCTYVITDGLVVVREVTAEHAEINIQVNCEGIAVYDVVFTIVRVADGRDGKDYEYIYTRTATMDAPSTPASQQSDDFVPGGWTDDSVGPAIELPYEWVSKRIKRNGEWGNFSTPSLWARFGEDGTDYEYIYTRTVGGVAPETPQCEQSDDFIPKNWTDDPVGPTLNLPYEWVSKRIKTNGVWGSFSLPALWAKYAEDGTNHEFIYRRTTTYSTPSTPGTSQTDDYIPSGWTDDPVGVTSTYIYEWMSKRDKVKGTWGNFSTPSLWAKYSFDGQTGSPGVDGRSEYTVYRRSEYQPATPSGSTLPPSGWALDPPLGSFPLWGSKAVFNGNGSLYRNWSTPVKISGETGAAGSTGPAITYRGVYSSSKQYSGSPERVDVVKDGSYWYMAKTTAGVIPSAPPTNTTYWTRLQGQFESLATGLLIADQANISGWRFRENYIESQNNNVVLDGSTNVGPKIALGASYANRENAPLKLYDDGRAVMKKGEIGGYTISSSGLSKDGMSLSGEVIRFNKGSINAAFGNNTANAVLGRDIPLSVENNTPSYPDINTAAYFKASGGGVNEAIRAYGNINVDGSVYDFKHVLFNPTSQSNAFPIHLGTTFFLYSTAYSTVYLPSKASIYQALGIKNGYCKVRVTAITSNWGVGQYNIFPPPGMTLFNMDGKQVSYYGLGKNVARDIIVYVMDTFYAYILS